jgi:hypothetical protein
MISDFIIQNYNFRDERFLVTLKNIFLYAHFSYRKLLSHELLIKSPQSEITREMIQMRLVSTLAMREIFKDTSYVDLIDSRIEFEKEACIIIYNRFDMD